MTLRLPSIPMIFAATGLLLLALARPADATQWQAVHSTARNQIEIDLDSIVKKDGGSTAWMQQVYAEPTASKSGAYFVFRSVKSQVRYQCAQKSLTVLLRSYVDDHGEVVGSEKPAEGAQAVVPGSPQGQALEIACASDPRKAAGAPKRPVAAAQR